MQTKRIDRRILLSVPHMGGSELKHVEEAFQSNWLSTVGPNLAALERKFSDYVGVPGVALGSGTAGIHLGLKLLNIGPGSEVLGPTLTFAASCNPILYEHATPVFIDSERETWNVDPNLLADFLKKRAGINRLPDALVVVHLFGQSADMDSIRETCLRYEVPILEDAAEALGALYEGNVPGTLGDVGVYSFNGNKIITGTSGGMLVSRESEWVQKARFWSTQARDRDPEGLNNYLHSDLGYNYRMSNVLAGIVLGQLDVLDLRVQQRRAVFERYCRGFEDLEGIEPQPEVGAAAGFQLRGLASETDNQQPVTDNRSRGLEDGASETDNRQLVTKNQSVHTRWLSCFLIDEKEFGMSQEELIHVLDAANIESRPVWKPMHTQKLYEKYECIGGQVAEDLNRRGICLPSSSCLTEEEQEFVMERVREAATQSKKLKR